MNATSSALTYSLNTATAAQIASHLRACSSSFNPPLEGKVDIEAYAAKMAAHAERFEAWDEGELVGLVCAYLNDLDHRRGFITNVSTLASRSGRGIGSTLLGHCITYARTGGFREIRLEVHPQSTGAIRLYEKAGLKVIEHRPASLIMQLELPHPCPPME